MRVAKFGGTSLASAAEFRKVKKIIESDPRRRYVVPSAPGRLSPAGDKVTDLFYKCHELIRVKGSPHQIFTAISRRYEDIVAGLGIELDLDSYLAAVYKQMLKEIKPDYAASRGEYLNGIILAAYLGFDFVDAADIIKFNERGNLDLAQTEQLVQDRLQAHKCAVIPGFYGTLPTGAVKTFARGGSDITGAIIAGSIGAAVYENWTDVSGIFMADPRIVPNPRQVSVITYSELRELAYNGANVLHEAAIYPVSQKGIPINIRNTNEPENPGTTIIKEYVPQDNSGVTGIAGKKGFVIISIEKALMDLELGFVRRLLSILEELNISFSHLPSGIDIVSLVIEESELTDKIEQVINLIEERLQPDKVEVFHNIALIATVGQGMAYQSGIAGKLFNALGQAEINVRMIDQGASEINIIVGIDNKDCENAIRAIYQAYIQ